MYYTHPQETWTAAQCRKIARRREKDGCGTPYPFKGYISLSGGLVTQGGIGKQRLNGWGECNSRRARAERGMSLSVPAQFWREKGCLT
jgi:hypothetical protein